MTHKHEHCMHDLKYCDHCDVVYCTKCDREWGGHTHSYWYWSGVPYKITWTSIGNGWEVYNANTGIKCNDANVIAAFNSTTNKDDYISHEH